MSVFDNNITSTPINGELLRSIYAQYPATLEDAVDRILMYIYAYTRLKPIGDIRGGMYKMELPRGMLDEMFRVNKNKGWYIQDIEKELFKKGIRLKYSGNKYIISWDLIDENRDYPIGILYYMDFKY